MSESLPMEVFDGSDEINDLTQLQFTKEFISDIAKKRIKHESKLAWSTLESYTEYIQLEKRLFALVNCKDTLTEKKKSMEMRLIKKINKLYRAALNKFPNEYDLMIDYFKFCCQVKAKIRASEIIEIVLEKYPEKEETWLMAISYYIQNRAPRSKIKETISRALAKHPTSKEIYFEIFRFELHSINMQLGEMKNYINLFFINADRDVDYYFGVLERIDKYENGNVVKDYFFEKIMENCESEPAVWENLVKRQCSDLYIPQKYARLISSEEKIAQCIAIYEEGINVVPESKKIDLYSLYLKFLLETLEDREIQETLRRDDLKLVNEKFESAHRGRHLTEDFYYYWLELDKKLRNSDIVNQMVGSVRPTKTTFKTDLEIYEKGLEAYPQSVKLWQDYLCAVIRYDQTSEEIPRIFEKATKTIKEDSVDLWKTYISYCVDVKENDYIDSVFERAMRNPQVAPALAPKYLSWTYSNYGITKCRSVYEDFIQQHRPCKELHAAMLKYEFFEFDGRCENWDKVFKRALEQFPHDIDTWVDYMQFHVKFRRSSDETVSALYARALSALPDSLQLLLRQRVSPDES